ncbi:TnsD family Tn7-like transposition protein [Bacillus tuaregi]|uniref:TnsD family Tn7-like transposition protein n=1 Tax=Bacillus tuaregi TaxID=1816695 RepID=UPI0008F8F897|nr:TnsD family Tn7-like transposition protein [Bacillus tuaregi]
MSLVFFPSPYSDDELLYSICARYHKRSGNVHEKATLHDLFSNRGLTTSVFLPSGISALVSNMPPFSGYSEEQFVFENTLYPYNSAFLPANQANKVYQSMLSNDGKDIYVRAGVVASGVPQNKFIRFCPLCFEEDEKKYGEPYFHRTHQLSGIHCCLEHFMPLYSSTILASGGSKHRFEFASKDNCIINEDHNTLGHLSVSTKEKYINHVIQLAPYLKGLLNKRFDHKELNWFEQKYKQALIAKGIAYYSGRVKQEDWRAFFEKRYDQSVLDLFYSSLSSKGDWLSMIVQKHRKSFHPLRHILVMNALGISLNDMFGTGLKSPFGSSPWFCLNPVCDYYRQPVIKDIELTLSDKTKDPVGTFKCPNCGYTYTRRGPDRTQQDRLRKTRVKSYGEVWKTKLRELSKLDLSLRELSRRMGADPNTIKRFLNDEKESNWNIEQKTNSVKEDCQNWMSLQRKYPQKSIKQLREAEKALYMRLYRNNREWLKANSPKPIKRTSPERIDWNKRDEEILERVSEAVKNLLNSEDRPVRITIGKVGNLIGERAILEKKFDKLPRTMKYLQEKAETVEQFTERRIEHVINEMYKNNEELKTWIILRKSGIKDWNLWKKTVEEKIKSREYLFSIE